MDMEARFLSPTEAARYLRIHRETLYGLVRKRIIKASKIGGRWLIPVASLDNLVNQETSTPRAPATETAGPGYSRPLPLQRLSARQECARPKRVLVVDDNRHVRDSFQAVLARRGHTVALAGGGSEAVEMVKDDFYDFIFIDLVMAGMDGVDTLKAIRDIDPDPTVVLITGYPDGALVGRALSMGPFVVLGKPIRVDDILRVVERQHGRLSSGTQ